MLFLHFLGRADAADCANHTPPILP
jgi:hypothetical protein